MIELNKKTQQDFLNREWVQRLLDAGVDMSDCKYFIGKWSSVKNQPDIIVSRQIKNYFDIKSGDYALPEIHAHLDNVIPTYTVSELLYKLHEYIYPTIDGIEYSGGLKFCKDAPFYIWYYALEGYIPLKENPEKAVYDQKHEYVSAEAEYPIESLASLLIQCHKKDIGFERKDTGDISDK